MKCRVWQQTICPVFTLDVELSRARAETIELHGLFGKLYIDRDLHMPKAGQPAANGMQNPRSVRLPKELALAGITARDLSRSPSCAACHRHGRVSNIEMRIARSRSGSRPGSNRVHSAPNYQAVGRATTPLAIGPIWRERRTQLEILRPRAGGLYPAFERYQALGAKPVLSIFKEYFA
jgi:hypothetical protein